MQYEQKSFLSLPQILLWTEATPRVNGLTRRPMIPSTAPVGRAGYAGDVRLRERVRLWRQFRRQAATTGALTPSPRYLATAMVRPLRQHRRTTAAAPIKVVEMGPGTGAITREIACLLRPGDTLDGYEIDDGFASYLRQPVATDELFESVRDGVRMHVMPAQAASLDSAPSSSSAVCH